MQNVIRCIINEIFEVEQFDCAKLAKYIRCVFQALLPSNDNASMVLLDQALQVAQEGREGGVQFPFPKLELEWLVASTFNRGVDYFARGEETLCHKWAAKAVELARFVDDGGSLVRTVQQRLFGLRLPRSEQKKIILSPI